MTILAQALIRPVRARLAPLAPRQLAPAFVSSARAGFATSHMCRNDKDALAGLGLLGSRLAANGSKNGAQNGAQSGARNAAAPTEDSTSKNDRHRSLLNLLKHANPTSRDKSNYGQPKGGLQVTPNDIHRPTITPPRTGPLVGRSVAVHTPELLRYAVRQVNALNRVDNVKQTVNVQRFAERPGKKRLRIRVARQRREFNDGVRRLFQLVKRAKRQGY